MASTESDALPVEPSRSLIRTRVWATFAAELLAASYVAMVAFIAEFFRAPFLMFPELGALAHDVLTRPRGLWARAPLQLALVPVITATIGLLFARNWPYGYVPMLATVTASIAVIVLLRSPIAPAISAGLLPIVMDVKSPWYPPGILFGTVLLVTVSFLQRRGVSRRLQGQGPARETVDDELERPAADIGGCVAVFLFSAMMVALVDWTGWRFLFFPPLAVIAFEMLGNIEVAPWAKRPLRLPLACFFTAVGGFGCHVLIGVGAWSAFFSMVWGIGMLRLFRIHLPPALSVALLPQVMGVCTWHYPLAVGGGTVLVVAASFLYRGIREKIGHSG